MAAPRVVPLCLLCLALALPAVALAQTGAGDDQYQDPLGSSTTETTGTVPTQSPGTEGETESPPPLTQTPPAPPSTAGQDSEGEPRARSELADTGAEPLLVLLLGYGLLLSGVGLRLRIAGVA